MCQECIRLSRECKSCGNEWHADHPRDAALAFVCPTCIQGYCPDCAIQDNGAVHCPECFESLDNFKIKTNTELIDEITSATKKVELENYLEELERIGSEGPNSLSTNAPPAPATRRRRAPMKRPDNVEPDIEIPLPRVTTTRVTPDTIISSQTRKYIKKEYGISDPAQWLEDLYSTKSEIVGSFPLTIMLGKSFDGGIDICATEVAARKLQEQLTRDGYQREADMQGFTMPFVKRTEVWARGTAQIKFIIMPTMRVAEYLAAADLTVVQNRFNGREFQIGSNDTLEWRGQVLQGGVTDRVLKYHRRGFRIMIPLTDDMIAKL